MINFKNKKILITGATGGIGGALVKKFISLGGTVVGTGTKQEKLDALKKKLSRLKNQKIWFGGTFRYREIYRVSDLWNGRFRYFNK